MYLGRMVACGRASDGKMYLYYRVSSRSFADRVPSLEPGRVSVIPASRTSDDFKNPYVTYNCCRYGQDICVLTNGAHTDPIFEKCLRGASPRDAISSVLLGMDYEFDGHDTPRIAMYANATSGTVYFGIITSTMVQVEKVSLAPNQLTMLSTNEYNFIDRQRRFESFDVASLAEAMDYVFDGAIFREHEHGVLALALELAPSFPIASRSRLDR